MTSVLPTDIIVQRCDDRKWQYAKPLEDIDEWLAHKTDVFDPKFAHRLYWPDRPYRAGMDILVIDGGTTQGPVIARTNPEAKITVTVHSKESLDHAIYLKHKYLLDNLTLRLLPIREIAELRQSFDLIIASGVLQQATYSEAQLAMSAIGQLLRPDGVAAVLLYSRPLLTESTGVFCNGGSGHFVHYGIDFSVEDCLELISGAGLVFQDWMVKLPYYAPRQAISESEFIRGISELPEPEMWSVMDRLRNRDGCHLFTACRPDRRPETYRIDFTSPRVADLVPEWRLNSGLANEHAVSPAWSMPLDPVSLELAAKIDGRRTIREISGHSGLDVAADELFRELWRMDFITILVPS